VQRADFRVPEVQWDPENPFPVDLNDLVARNKKDLMRSYGMPETCAVQELRLERYSPDGAVPDVSERLQKHRWHWIVSCGYAKGCSESVYEAFLLLDGRTLTVRVPDDTSRGSTEVAPESEPQPGADPNQPFRQQPNLEPTMAGSGRSR
jgi:hypothetical protein